MFGRWWTKQQSGIDFEATSNGTTVRDLKPYGMPAKVSPCAAFSRMYHGPKSGLLDGPDRCSLISRRSSRYRPW